MIGIFDSGFGGLTVLKYFLRDLVEYDYIYLGDNARAPYGEKSQEVIYSYTCDALDFLFSKGCNLVILACNTASSKALRKIQQEYLPQKYPNKKVLGVIRPLVEEAAKDNYKKVGVIGTKATINSGVYKTELDKFKKDIEVIQKAAPLLVPLIEEGWLKKRETKMILKKYLRILKDKQINSLILGCTHYPILLKEIKNVLNKKCKVYNPGEIVAKSLRDYLNRHNELVLKKSKIINIIFYTTDDVEMFRKIGKKFLERDIGIVNKIKL